jgi:NDP-sugar pyrophosphorylase family protein
MNDLIEHVSNILISSLTEYKDLTTADIEILVKQGNSSSDWSCVRIKSGCSINRIKGCIFNGSAILIGYFGGRDSTKVNGKDVILPSGLYNSNFSGICIIEDNAYVFNTTMVANIYIGKGSAIMNCGVLMGNESGGSEDKQFGPKERLICVGSEADSPSGPLSRTVPFTSNATYYDVCYHALTKKQGERLSSIVGEEKRYHLTILDEKVMISHCHSIQDSYIGKGTTIDNSSLLSSILMDRCKLIHCEVDNCILHSCCSVESRSTLLYVLMFDHSHISHGALVEESILGPDGSAASGECKRCILGPFVGFHHQSLLISACWPLGKGNIAYGSMIGANHTGRAPDQESMPGEGCFFGLNVAIKLPFNTLASPYSFITGGSYPSQRIAFPFSLVSNGEGGQPSLVRPGWVLWSNPYFIERSLSKFTKRRKSTIYRTDLPIYRPSIVDMVVDSRSRLLSSQKSEAAKEGGGAGVFNDSILPGVGKCVVSRSDVNRSVQAYSQFIHRYALHVSGCLVLLLRIDLSYIAYLGFALYASI